MFEITTNFTAKTKNCVERFQSTMSQQKEDHEYCFDNKTVGSLIPKILNYTYCYKLLELSDNPMLTQKVLSKIKWLPKDILTCWEDQKPSFERKYLSKAEKI